MTTPTHGTIAFIIGAIVAQIDLTLGVVFGSILGLAHHLITDRLVFEWGPWHEKSLKRKMICALSFVVPYLIYVYIILSILKVSSLWLFIPMLFGILPDIIGVKFPFHENTQTWAGTLSSSTTVFVEFVMVLLFFMIFYRITIVVSVTSFYVIFLLVISYLYTLIVGKFIGRKD